MRCAFVESVCLFSSHGILFFVLRTCFQRWQISKLAKTPTSGDITYWYITWQPPSGVEINENKHTVPTMTDIISVSNVAASFPRLAPSATLVLQYRS